MKKLLIGIGIRIAILYVIILAIHYFTKAPLEYLAFFIGIVLAFLTFSGNSGFSKLSQGDAALEYGDHKISPSKKEVIGSSVNPLFVASLLVFLTSFIIMYFS